MDKKFKQIYYSDGGYWRGKSAIQRLAKASGSTKEEAEKWLLKQPLYQIYSQDNFYLTCSRNLVAFVIYMDLSLGFVYT